MTKDHRFARSPGRDDVPAGQPDDVPAGQPDHLMADGDGSWAAYAESLGALHQARDDAFRTFRAGQVADAEHRAALDRLTTRLRDHRTAIEELATRLRAPAITVDLAPRALLSPGGSSLTDLQDRVDDVDTVLTQARHVATLPQFLPGWRSPLARAAVVYAGFGIPNLLLSVLLSLAEVDSPGALLYFAVIWPAVTAIGGGIVVRIVTRPRSGDDSSFRRHPNDTGTDIAENTAAVADSVGRRERRYRWLGLLVAWTTWLVPSGTLVWIASLLPG